MEAASGAARELRKRYDLFYLHLDTQTPVRLTSVVRWAVSTSKIPPHAWKAPVPTSVIEEYLTENPNLNDAFPSSSREKKRDWKLEVDKFISKCHELDLEGGQGQSGISFTDDPPRGHRGTRSVISSRAESISEGHLSPDQERGQGRSVPSFTDDPPWGQRRTRSVISSRAGSTSEGHISPDQERGQGRPGLPFTDNPPRRHRKTRSAISLRAGSISEGHISPDKERGQGRPGLPFTDDPPRRHRKARSVISLRAGSISEGHISPDEDGPSRKVLHHDDWMR